MIKEKTENGISSWRFRREVTLGTVVQLTALVIVLIAGWTSLKEELTYIRFELNQMVQTQTQLQDDVQQVREQGWEYAYRLQTLEQKTVEKHLTTE